MVFLFMTRMNPNLKVEKNEMLSFQTISEIPGVKPQTAATGDDPRNQNKK
jgi:hypothetical protein